MESETLKPCPFCGGEPRISDGTPFNYCRLVCQCGVLVDKGFRDTAIAAWNTRPVDPIIEAAQKVADAARLFDSARNRSVIGAVDNRNSVILAARALAALLPPNSANSPVIPEGSEREWRRRSSFASDPTKDRGYAEALGETPYWSSSTLQFSDDSGTTWQDAPETPNAQ